MTFHAHTRQTILLHCKKWLLQHLRPCFLKIPKYKLLVDMTTFLFDILLTLQIFTSWCEMRKTIKSVKYPFSRDWNPFAHHTFHVGDKKEATACWKYRTFSYNEGFGSTFMVTSFFGSRECPKDHCEDNFGAFPSDGKRGWRLTTSKLVLPTSSFPTATRHELRRRFNKPIKRDGSSTCTRTDKTCLNGKASAMQSVWSSNLS